MFVKFVLHTSLNKIKSYLKKMNPLQKEILLKLRYRSFLSYNRLWGKEGDSSKFAYHLRALEKSDLVEKKTEGYKLTSRGIKTIDYLTLKAPQPLIVVIVVTKKGNQVLLTKRMKYPFKGYQEFCSSKIYQGETIEQAAKDRLRRKIGFTGEVTYKGVEFLQTKEKKELVMHHHLHIFLADNLKGQKKKGTWVKISPFSPEKPLPHLEQTLKIALDSGFSVAFTEMLKEGDKFTSYTTNSYQNFNH